MDGGGRKLRTLEASKREAPSAVAPRGTRMLNLLPLAVRRRLRQFGKFVDTLEPPRAGLGVALAVSVIASSWLYGAVQGGHAPTLVSGIASGVGLKTGAFVLSGQIETSEADIVDALGLDGRQSLVGLDAAEARRRLLELPWVEAAAVRKLYPGKLTVSIVEKRPMAVWQHDDRMTVVGSNGVPIADFGIAELINNRFADLPHLVGDGAADSADEILPLASKHPQIAARAAAYLRVGGRRWDVQLANGLRIQFPERALGDAVMRAARLQATHRIFERQIAVLDLRLPDRTIMRLEPDAAKLRGEFVAARLKAMKKADRKL